MTDDFRLAAGSPSVDTGVELAGAYAELLEDVLDVDDDMDDLEGTPDLDLQERVRAGSVGGCKRVDMGPYEREQECRVGDLDEDCTVDGEDLGALLSAWGACAAPCPADLDCDGTVGGEDLGLLLSGWGIPRDCCGASLLSGSMLSGGAMFTLAELLEMLDMTSTSEFVEWVTQLSFGEMMNWMELLGA